MSTLKAPRLDSRVVGGSEASDSVTGGSIIRICFMIDELRTGGTETQLLRLIDNLDREKFQPYLCLLDGTADSSRQLEPTNCPIIRLGVRRLLSGKGIAGAWQLVRFLKQHQVDIMQVHFPDSTYLGVPAARLAGVRCIIRTRRDLFYWVTPMHRRWGRYLDQFYNRHWVTALAVNCEAVKEKAIEDEGLDGLPIEVIPNAMDFTPYDGRVRPERSGGVVNIGTIAMLRPEKRLDVLVEAARLVKLENDRVQFFIAGEGPERPRLEKLIEQYDLAGTVHLLGRVADIPGFLDNIDIGVLTSESEGLSNALIECMATGIPVVASAVGGNVDLVEEGQTGRLFPANSSTALAGALIDLAEHQNNRITMGRRAAREARMRFSIHPVLKQYKSFCKQMLSRCGESGITITLFD